VPEVPDGMDIDRTQANPESNSSFSGDSEKLIPQ
jgi:hypothetical protein